MATNQTIKTLATIVKKEIDEATKKLAHAIKMHEDAKNKHNLLLKYENEYNQQLQGKMLSGINVNELQNFYTFKHKISTALEQQQLVVQKTEKQVEQERQKYIQCSQKQMTVQALEKRNKESDKIKEKRKEQKENDEYAARMTRNNKPFSNLKNF